ncbi:MAG TPA: aminopeptidase [Longimicrobiales bacterium]
MPRTRNAALAAAGALLLLASHLQAQTSARAELDWSALADRMVRSLALTPGERVLLVGHPGFAPELVRPLRLAVARAGGVDMGHLEVLSHPWPGGTDGAALARSAEAARETFRDMYDGRVDATIFLPGATSDHPAYRAIQDLLNAGRGRVIHFHWEANGSVVTIPGQPVPPAYEVDLAYQRAVLETDYRDLAARQRRFEAAMRAGEVRVTTPSGTDIRFRIGDRPVNLQDGDASAARMERARILIDREIELPAGAVRVAPLEETVQGRIVFPLSTWRGRTVRDLALDFEDGTIVAVTAESGADAVEAELDAAGEGARRFREFALGLNPLLAVPEEGRWIPYYGYGAGVVRLSIGDNLELGGAVGGGYYRWNFFEDASVWVGGERWVDGGRLVMGS